MPYSIVLRILPYSIPFIAGLSIGYWAAVKIHNDDKVKGLEAQIEQFKKDDTESRAAFRKYDNEKQAIEEKKVIYVEKPHYVDCRPDREWLRDFNASVAE